MKIGGERRAENEDACLLEEVDDRVLHRDRVLASRELAVGHDGVIALVAGRRLAGEFVHLGDVHVVDDDVGVQRVNPGELTAGIGDGALVVAVDGQTLDGDGGAVLDADNRVLIGQGTGAVHHVDREVRRIGRLDDGLALPGSDQGDCLGVDGQLFLVGPGGDQNGVAVRCGGDRRLDRGVATIADEEDLARSGAVDLLYPVEEIGSFGSGAHLPAGLSAGSGRIGVGDGAQAAGGQGRGIDGRVDPGTAIEHVIAGAAGDRVIAAVGEDRHGPNAAVDDGVGARRPDGQLRVVEARRQHRTGAEIGRIEVDRVHPRAEIGEGVAVDVDVVQPGDRRGIGRRAAGEALEGNGAVDRIDVGEGVAGHGDVGDAVGPPGVLDHQAAVLRAVGGDRHCRCSGRYCQ